jgi:hypothetical protein
VSAGRRQQRFRAGDGWLVKVVSIQPPGADVASQFYQVLHHSCLVKETTDADLVRRLMGDAVFSQLQETEL